MLTNSDILETLAPLPNPLQHHATIGRRYQLIEILGEGGMGSAWKTRDRLTNQIITLKRGRSVLPDKERNASTQLSFALADGLSEAATQAQTALSDGALSLDETAFDGQALEDSLEQTFAPGALKVDGDEGHRDLGLDHTAFPGAGLMTSHNVLESDQDRLETMRSWDEVSDTDNPRLRLALAQEFEVLSGLRHPNIISVLDYGFDSVQQPYFTMEYVSDALPFDEACKGLSLMEKVAYLLQSLEALAYLHRRGVIHRDIKPSNVLVAQGRVKVLDFGISLRSEEVAQSQQSLAGTFGFIAPEVLCGAPSSERSDLFSMGVMAARAFFSVVPSKLRGLEPSAQPQEDPVMFRAVVKLVQRLCATMPEKRPESAQETIKALYAAINQPQPPESDATRESYLQAASFVGRDAELATLMKLFQEASARRGNMAMVAGESGVGKSRLLQELRTQVLVRGGLVLRGQAVRHGANAFQLWRDIGGRLALQMPITPKEASVLKAIEPDIASILGVEEIPNAPTQDPETDQQRIFDMLESLLRRQPQPVLIIAEDLQWATTESLKALAHLREALHKLPVLIIGNYRDDEEHRLHELLPDVQTIELKRLDQDSIAALSASILGDAGRDETILSVLREESEGNPFFIVELVRAYAQIAGRLDDVTSDNLTKKLLPDGISSLVKGRLDRLDAQDRALLRLSAIGGRDLDLDVLKVLAPERDWDVTLSGWIDAAVIDIIEGHPRFAHDKIREQLLGETLPGEPQRRSHRQIAEAIEQAHGAQHSDFVGALAYHWAMAEDSNKASTYGGIVAELSIRFGAYQEAIEVIERALALIDRHEPQDAQTFISPWLLPRLFGPGQMPAANSREARRARLEGLLGEARSQLGEVMSGMEHGRMALAALGVPMPEQQSQYILSLLGQAGLLASQTLLKQGLPQEDASARENRLLATAIQTRITEICFYTQEPLTMFWSAFRSLTLGQPAGPSRELARGYILLGVVLGIIPQHALAKYFCRRAMETAHEVGEPYEIGFVGQRNAVYHIYIAQWQVVEDGLNEVLDVATEVGNARQILESNAIKGHSLIYRGQFETSYETFSTVAQLAAASEDSQARLWGATGRCFNLMHLERYDEAQEMLDLATECMSDQIASADAINYHACCAQMNAHAGHADEVIAALTRSLEFIDQGPLVAYWTLPGLSFSTEACLRTLGQPDLLSSQRATLRDYAKRLLEALASFGKRFPFGQPAALLWQGLWQQHQNKDRAAQKTLRQCAEVARRLHMPYELNRALKAI